MAAEYFKGTDCRIGGGIASKQMSVGLIATRGCILKAKRTGASVGFGETNGADQDAARERRLTELEIEMEWLEHALVDPEAFAPFYEKYRQRVFAQVLSMTRDFDLAADMTAETFFIAMVTLDTFRWKGRPFGTWLARIARNLVNGEFRRRKVRREVCLDPDHHDRAGGQRSDRAVVRMDEDRILRKCLGRLRTGQRQTIDCHYFDELTTKEIALALGVAESTAKSRLQEGRRQLRLWLVECGVDRRGEESRMGVRKSALEER